MGREQNLALCDMPRQTGIARAPRGVLQTMLADPRDLHAFHRAGNFQTIAGLLCAPRPTGRFRMQPVIHMYRLQWQIQRFAQLAKRMQEDAGIKAAAEGDCQIGRASCRERVEISVGAVSLKKRKRDTGFDCDWSSDVCSSDLGKSSDSRSWQSACRRTQESRPPLKATVSGVAEERPRRCRTYANAEGENTLSKKGLIK